MSYHVPFTNSILCSWYKQPLTCQKLPLVRGPCGACSQKTYERVTALGQRCFWICATRDAAGGIVGDTFGKRPSLPKGLWPVGNTCWSENTSEGLAACESPILQ